MVDFVEYLLGFSIDSDFYPILIVSCTFFSLLAITHFTDFVKALFGVHM